MILAGLMRLIVVECLLLALGVLATAERLRNQRVGEHELGLGHVFDRQHDVGGLARRRVVAMDAREMALGAEQLAAEPLAALGGHRHLDLHLIAGVALEIRLPHQRPVDAGRRQLQPVGAIDRIGRVEHRRQRARARLAIVDRHRAVGPLGHHLHGAAVEPRHAHAHQAIAQAFQHRLDHGCDTRRKPGSTIRRFSAPSAALCVSIVSVIRPLWCRFAAAWVPVTLGIFALFLSPRSEGRSGNKKERVPGGPLSKSDRIIRSL